MTALNEVISNLTEEFAKALIVALGKLSIDEFAGISVDKAARPRPTNVERRSAGKTKTGGKRVRRTASDIEALVDRIVLFVGKREAGCTAERIRGGLGVERKELPRALKEALAKRLLTKKGQKRATVYFAGRAKTGKNIVKKSGKHSKANGVSAPASAA